MGNVLVGFGQQGPASSDTSYFCELGDYLASLMSSDFLTAESLHSLVNKQIYLKFSDFPVPKVVKEATNANDYKLAWIRLHSPFVTHELKDILYLLLHNKLPVAERLFRIGFKNDPYCLNCPQAVIADVEHFFCQCERSKAGWKLLRSLLIEINGRRGMLCSNFTLLNLLSPAKEDQRETTWLVSNFVYYTWNQAYVNGVDIKPQNLFNHLHCEFKKDIKRLQLPRLSRLFHRVVTGSYDVRLLLDN